MPGTERPCEIATAVVVVLDPLLRIIREARIATIGKADTANVIDVMHLLLLLLASSTTLLRSSLSLRASEGILRHSFGRRLYHPLLVLP